MRNAVTKCGDSDSVPLDKTALARSAGIPLSGVEIVAAVTDSPNAAHGNTFIAAVMDILPNWRTNSAHGNGIVGKRRSERAMAKQGTLSVRLRIVYDGTPPNVWDGSARDFGLQDKDNVLHTGKPERSGAILFDVAIDVKPERAAGPVLLGKFAHGPPGKQFLYLSWRNTNGVYAQRLKLPLGGITWADIDNAQGKPLIGEVAPSNKPRVPGGTNIGGTRAIAWKPMNG